MRHRLRQLLGDGADAMWIGTFHATCEKLLRRFGSHVGLTRSFVIFDDNDQIKLIEKLLKETGLDEQVSPRTILSRIDRAKNRGIDPVTPTGAFDDVIERIYPLYQAQLAKENAVDFNDLYSRRSSCSSVAAAAVGQVSPRPGRRVQDTNKVQYQLVWRFAEASAT
jgi:DNA helicase-2/ATP-dependent DNA helicase PcrA